MITATGHIIELRPAPSHEYRHITQAHTHTAHTGELSAFCQGLASSAGLVIKTPTLTVRNLQYLLRFWYPAQRVSWLTRSGKFVPLIAQGCHFGRDKRQK